MPTIKNKDELLADLREDYTTHFTIAGLLLAAHAACLGYCIKVLNDYASANPVNRGVGIFVAIFGAGLIAAIVNYASLFFARMVARNAIRSDRDPNDEPSAEFLKRAAWYSLLIAGFALILGILIFVVRYALY